jgi:hypothetical protein
MRRRWVAVAIVSSMLVLGLVAFYMRWRRQVEHLMLTEIPVGMVAADVRRVLGPPAEVQPKGHFTGDGGRCRELPVASRWVYSMSSFHRAIYFDENGRAVCDESEVIHV